MTKQVKSEWEEEFEKIMRCPSCGEYESKGDSMCGFETDIQKLKDFISQEISLARKEEREKVVEKIKDWIEKSFHSNDYVANEIVKFLASLSEEK